MIPVKYFNHIKKFNFVNNKLKFLKFSTIKNFVDYKNIKFFKITNTKENHNGFQYKDGLNILDKKFDSNEKSSCSPGGLYFTTKEYISNFYNYGCNLRRIELPFNDPDFKMVKDPCGDKWRANKIILKEKYSLDDPNTYKQFGIDYPDTNECIRKRLFGLMEHIMINGGSFYGYHAEIFHNLVVFNNNNLKFLKLLVKNGADLHIMNEYLLRQNAENGNLEIVKYLVEQGADVRACNDYAVVWSAGNGHLNVVKYLVEKGADIRTTDDRAIKLASNHGHLNVVKYLVENGANIRAGDDFSLQLSAENGHFDVVKYLVEKGANVNSFNGYSLRKSAKHGHFKVVKFLVENGADIHANNDEALTSAINNGHSDIATYLKEKGGKL